MQTELSALRDIHLPTAIGWWPLAPLYYVVIAVVLCATVVASVWGWRRRRRLRYVRQAQRQFAELCDRPSTAEVAAALSYLLKQLCLLHFPDEPVAELHGERWLRFLDRCVSGETDFVGQARALIDAPFMPPTRPVALASTIATTATWLAALTTQLKRGKREGVCFN